MSTARQPKGIPVGGQFAAAVHSEPALSLAPQLHVDKDTANHFADQAESIRNAGLAGSLTSNGDTLTYTSPDGDAYEIRQDGHTREDGTPGWAISNEPHTDVDDHAYALRSETTTEELGDDLQDMVFDAACTRAFTLNEGTEQLDFRSFSFTRSGDGHMVTNANFVDIDSLDDLDIYFDHDNAKLTVYWDNSGQEGKDADEVLKDLVRSVDIECPDGSPSEQMAWHMERSFRMAAAKEDSPAWAHGYRVPGLRWEDRLDGR